MREFVTGINASLGTLCLEKTPMKTWIDCINAILAGLKRVIKTFFGCYLPKGVTKIQLIGEKNMGLLYRAFLPEAVDSDVVSREVGVSVDGVSSILRVPVESKFVDLPAIAEGASVAVVLRDTDDAGNVSEWSEEVSFIARDTIPPNKPGAPSLKLLGEVSDPVSPEPEPEPVVEPTGWVAIIDSATGVLHREG